MKPVQGLKTIADFTGWPVYIRCKGGDVDGILVQGDLYDDGWKQSKGQIPLELDISCPRCGQVNRIAEQKTIHLRRLPEPRRFVGPTGDWHAQLFVVSVDENMVCDHPVGKTICGLRFRITENVLHQVG